MVPATKLANYSAADLAALRPSVLAKLRSLEQRKPLPSSAPSGQQAREIETMRAGDDHPGWALTPSSLLVAFLRAEAGDPRRQCRLFDDVVENDGALGSMLDGRRQAVAGKPRVIQAVNGSAASKKAAEILTIAMRSIPNITQVIEHLLGFNKYGYAASEIVWSAVRIGGRLRIVPTSLLVVPADRFVIGDPLALTGRVDELRLITNSADLRGSDLIPGKWIVVDRAYPRLARGALMRSAAWPAMGKRFAFRDWLIFSEKFGIPFTLIKLKEGTVSDIESNIVARDIAANIGTDGSAVVSSDLDVEIVDGGRATNNETHSGLISHCNTEMAKIVNGSTLSNDNGSGSGSYGLGSVHESVRWDLITYDGERVQEAFGAQLFVPFMIFNGFDVADAPELRIQVVRDQTPGMRAEIATKTSALGVPISISQLRQETGMRAPLDASDATDPKFSNTAPPIEPKP